MIWILLIDRRKFKYLTLAANQIFQGYNVAAIVANVTVPKTDRKIEIC